MSRPNFLVITVDEMRFPPCYETPEILKWREEYLTAQRRLRKIGFEFLQHRASASACCPSRATLWTGQYPTYHGVSQTNGAAKGNFESDMFWLDPNTVPTAGNYLTLNGYRTYYQGKWNINAPNILIPGTHDGLESYDSEGVQTLRETKLYQEANRLGSFGFGDWVGPEPNGNNPRNTGASAAKGVSGRDIVYANESVRILEDMKEGDPPFFLVTSLVNPHDITLFGEVTKRLKRAYNFDLDPSVPKIPPAPTADESLQSKPDAQADYKLKYQQGFQPTIDDEYYRQLYYSLNLTVDREMNLVLDALMKSPHKSNTVIIFTSDHGSQVGAHGLFQKFYNAYEESIHVPCVIAVPKDLQARRPELKVFVQGGNTELLTTHVDLLPTILTIANIDGEETRAKLSRTHTSVADLVGNNLIRLLQSKEDLPVLFTTGDDVFRGANQTTISGKPYDSVIQPCSIQSVIVRVEGQLFKYSRYWDDPGLWTKPYQNNTVIKREQRIVKDATVIINTEFTYSEPVPSQFEMYNLTEDPIEANNLAGKRTRVERKLQRLLEAETKKKLLHNPQLRLSGAPIPKFPVLN